MMKGEFEKLLGYEVSQDDYDIAERWYVEGSLPKHVFARAIRGLIPPRKPCRHRITVNIPNDHGYRATPNGMYFTVEAELIDVDVATGLVMVALVPGSDGYSWKFDAQDDDVVFIDR